MVQSEGSQLTSSHPIRDAALQTQLLARRQRLQVAAASASDAGALLALLREVDSALERMDAGTFGVCETCHDPIEADRLLADPVIRNCLDHLSPEEQRALERDLDLAFQVQTGLLPKSELTVGGWSVAYHFEPAGPVSGDYCDLIVMEDTSALFVLGDVSGKGVAASMLMAQLHAIFRSLVTTTRNLNELVTKANSIFSEGTIASHFATLVCGWLNPDGAVEICNAGHPLPLHVTGDRVTPIESTDLPLGLFAGTSFSSRRLTLGSAASLVLYTDGLSESFNAAGDQYGIERLSVLLARQSRIAPKDLIAATLADVTRFRADAPKTDDLTVMVIRRER